jgi:hypothetical protein
MEQTGSENKGIRRIFSGLLKDRTTKALLLALLLSVAMGSMRPDQSIGMSAKSYWAKKINWKHCADAVLTGDSRVLMAVSPDIIEQYVDYRNVMNYAFGANWYCHEYMQATEELLEPNAPKKAIIMGFTPHSLTWRTANDMGHFIEISQRPPEDRFFDTHFGLVLNFFDPMSLQDAFRGLFPSTAPTWTIKDYRETGWVAVHKTPSDKNNEVKRYRGIFKERQVSDKTIAIVMEYVCRWSQSGIKVYGFVPPTCPDMVELEEKVSGFNKDQFVAEFKEAGGIWLDVNLTAYYSFDGSHLQDEGAIEFSHDLAKMIQKAENGTNKVACTN